MLTIIGSKPSPYVRRIRILLEMVKLPYEFEVIEVFSPAGQERLKSLSPVRKVPILLDGDKTISDSRKIFDYLGKQYLNKSLTWQEEELVTMINNANDDLVQLLMLKRSGFDIKSESLFFSNARSRIDEIFQDLQQKISAGIFKDWKFPSICLYCMLDWAQYRELIKLEDYSTLLNFRNENAHRPEVMATSIPQV